MSGITQTAADSVTQLELADDSVGTGELIDGDVKTVDIGDAEVTLAKIQNIPPDRVLGNDGVGAGPPIAMQTTNTRTMLGIEDPLFVRKGSPGTIVKGTPWQPVGFNPGGWTEVEEADPSVPPSMPAFSLASEDITNSTTVEIPSGIHAVTGLDTQTPGWSVQDQLFLAPGGGLQNTPPTGTNMVQKMAEVVRVHSSQGAVLVFGAGRENAVGNIPSGEFWIGNSSGVATPSAAGIVRPELVSVDAAHADTVAVSFKAVDALGVDVAAATLYRWWLSSSATTGAIHGTAPDGGVTATTGLKFADDTAGLRGSGLTGVGGVVTLSVNHAGGAVSYFLWAELGGRQLTSTVLEIT